jgi:ABC-type uncharacterized transport system substrate-binding protein
MPYPKSKEQEKWFWTTGNGSKQAGMGIKAIGVLVIGLALASVERAQAQQATKIPRIGFLVASSRAVNTAREEAFLQGLRDLGYLEGKNIVIEWRTAEGKLDRVAALAAELVRLKVDVMVTAGPADTRAAKEAMSTIPIVMTLTTIRLPTASSPAWPDLVETSLVCLHSPRS